jgi:serine protease Do
MIAVLLLALAQDPDLARVQEFQQKVRACVEKVRPAYVFFGQGSGVCVSPDGWVLTNYHVAGNRPGQRVRFPGGRAFTADVVGWDVHGDISLCRIRDAKDLPFCELGDSDALRVGQTVIAVGNPFMLGSRNWEPTVTMGIVSALHRYMDNPGYFDAIQTDAQINPGNSGGPLLTLEGKVAGINGRIDIRRFVSRVNTGIGYAIPANQIRRYLEAFKAGGRVHEGCIEGITVGECGDPRYEGVGEYGDGVFVAGVAEDTPADRAGFETGDIVVEVEGYRIHNLNRFHGVLGNWPQGETVRVKARRRGEVRELKVFLGDPAAIREREMKALPADFGFLPAGEDGPGIEVRSVKEGGPAGKAGLKAGDVIRKVDGAPTRGWDEFRRFLKSRKPGDEVKLGVTRDGKEIDLVLTTGKTTT